MNAYYQLAKEVVEYCDHTLWCKEDFCQLHVFLMQSGTLSCLSDLRPDAIRRLHKTIYLVDCDRFKALRREPDSGFTHICEHCILIPNPHTPAGYLAFAICLVNNGNMANNIGFEIGVVEVIRGQRSTY